MWQARRAEQLRQRGSGGPRPRQRPRPYRATPAPRSGPIAVVRRSSPHPAQIATGAPRTTIRTRSKIYAARCARRSTHTTARTTANDAPSPCSLPAPLGFRLDGPGHSALPGRCAAPASRAEGWAPRAADQEARIDGEVAALEQASDQARRAPGRGVATALRYEYRCHVYRVARRGADRQTNRR